MKTDRKIAIEAGVELSEVFSYRSQQNVLQFI